MRARLLPILALPALALPAACGDDADPLGLVSEAGAATVDDGVARLRSTTEVQADGATVTVQSEGLVDLEGDRASLTTQLSQGAELEVVADGTTLYLRGPDMAGELGVTTPWASVDLERVGR